MEPLVQWLLAGFVVSLLFIAIARWFWKRYDRPSEEAIEWERQKEEKRKEQEVWESVEMQMRREAEEAEGSCLRGTHGTPPRNPMGDIHGETIVN